MGILKSEKIKLIKRNELKNKQQKDAEKIDFAHLINIKKHWLLYNYYNTVCNIII